MRESVFCKICGLTIKPGAMQMPLLDLGVFIGSCVSQHYTIHVADKLIGFSDYVFVNGIEIERTCGEIENKTTAWHKEKMLWREQRCISDEELRQHYHRFLKLGVLL